MNVDKQLEYRIKKWLLIHADSADNSTVLAEMCADHFGHNEWLDDCTHPLWEWVFEYFLED